MCLAHPPGGEATWLPVKGGGWRRRGHRVPTPPPSSKRGKAGRNHLNEEMIPLLPTGIGERFGQTISNLEHVALLRRCEPPQ
jgi:hypothetical protein